MPPLSSLKILLSLATTTKSPYAESVIKSRGTYVIHFLDVKKAHFWAKVERQLYVELPEEYKQAKKYHRKPSGQATQKYVRHA